MMRYWTKTNGDTIKLYMEGTQTGYVWEFCHLSLSKEGGGFKLIELIEEWSPQSEPINTLEGRSITISDNRLRISCGFLTIIALIRVEADELKKILENILLS